MARRFIWVLLVALGGCGGGLPDEFAHRASELATTNTSPCPVHDHSQELKPTPSASEQYDLDKLIELPAGTSGSSSNHPMLDYDFALTKPPCAGGKRSSK